MFTYGTVRFAYTLAIMHMHMLEVAQMLTPVPHTGGGRKCFMSTTTPEKQSVYIGPERVKPKDADYYLYYLYYQ